MDTNLNKETENDSADNLFDWTQIGLVCSAYRKLNKMSQQDVADKIGLKRASVANFESGRQKLPIEKLALHANCLGLSCEVFMAKGKALNAFALIALDSKMPVAVSPNEEELKEDAKLKGWGSTEAELLANGYAISPIMWAIPSQENQQLAVAS